MENEAAQPGYWDDPRTAQNKMRELGRVKETVDLWRALQSESSGLLELIELAILEGDLTLEEEVQGELDSQEADKNSATKISVGREKLTRMILEKAREATPDFGIELRDIQLQRVNYTESVKLNNFRRMKAERQKFSDNYRAEGDAAASRINGKRSQELKTIQSEAYLQVQKIKGEADSLATGIYAEAYNLDPQFYEFIKSLESYRTTIREGDTLVLSSDSDYLTPLAKYQ